MPALLINLHSQTTVSLIRSIHLSKLAFVQRGPDNGGSTVLTRKKFKREIVGNPVKLYAQNSAHFNYPIEGVILNRAPLLFLE